jgi:colanic acid biosynthesis glycosyl transferase WcaI
LPDTEKDRALVARTKVSMAKNKENIVWILSELYYPEDSGSGYYTTKIAEAIAVRHCVRVLTVQPTHSARGTKAPTNEVLNNVHIHRCLATTLNKNILIFHLLNLLTISVSLFFNALRRIHKDDIVLVITNPPTLPFVAYVACKLRRAKLILRIEDVYPEVLVAAGLVKANSALVKVFNRINRRLYKRADHIILLGREMLRLVQTKNGNGAVHATLITHWADSDQITPLPRENNALLRDLGLLYKFVIQYSGNMGRTHDLASLIQCAKILESENDIHFLFIGSGAKERWLRKTVTEIGLKNVTILPPQSRSDLILSLNACDMAVISFVNGMAGVSVPSRMYNIMSAGKPILAVSDRESELSRVILEENIGWIVRPESPGLIAEAIMEANADRKLLYQMSLKARAVAVEKYSRPIIMQKHKDLMDNLAMHNGSFRQGIECESD